MSATTSTTTAPAAPRQNRGAAGIVRLLSIPVMVGGVILAVGGAVTWKLVQGSLSDERVAVAEDAPRYAGDPVDGPFTAYQQAEIIEKHALEASEGKTYAELDPEDPALDTVMNASFLRASLFTSVVSFGVAAMAMGLGVLFVLVGAALLKLAPAMAVRR